MAHKYGYWTNPKLPPWQRHCHALLSLPLHTIFSIQHNRDTAFHNLCTSLQPPSATGTLLWNGLKYNIESAKPKPHLDTHFERLCKDVRTKFNFKTPKLHVTDNQGNHHTLVQPEYDPKLYIPSQEYIPSPASPDIERSLIDFHTQLKTLVNNNVTHRRHNLPPQSRHLLRFFRKTHDFIILPTDKNLGPAILERATYIRRSLHNHLSDPNTYCRVSPMEASTLARKAESDMLQLIQETKPSWPPMKTPTSTGCSS
jgi:hypothetical protein